MGNQTQKVNKIQNRIQFAQLSQGIDSQIQEETHFQDKVEVSYCCGLRIQKEVKQKVVWQKSFILNCNQIKSQFEWAYRLIQMVNKNKMSKTRYLQQMKSIKNAQNYKDFYKQDSINSVQDMQNFKKKLKKSVIVSFRQTYQPQKQPKIHTSINPHHYSRIAIQRMPRSKAGNGNRPSNMSFVTSRSGLHKSLISFVDDTLSSVIGSDLGMTRQHALNLQVFLKFSIMLEKHLNDSGCILGLIKKQFIAYAQQAWRNTTKTAANIQDFVDNITQFLVILRQAVIDYYLLNFQDQKDKNPFICNDQNIMSACTAIVFKDVTFYNLVFSIVTIYNQSTQTRFEKTIKKLRNFNPERFMIKHKYCLNQATILNQFQELSRQSGGASIQNIQMQDNNPHQHDPYRNCIQKLQELSKTKSPINKMKAILACSDGITAQIQKFYQFHGLKKQKWVLDADQVLSIFCYIIVQANIQHLHSHLFILDHFATSHQMISISGYYFSVMNCALEQIQNQYGGEIDNL